VGTLMEIGVRIPHTGTGASPELITQWCAIAEAAGFGSLWGVDHVVMPRFSESKYVLGRRPVAIEPDAVSDQLAPNFELISTLAFVAALTERIKIGTAVAVLTIRNAVLNARQLATVDRLSNGRLVCGVGIGWLKEEADAMGMPWDCRGARAEEHVAVLRAIWGAPDSHIQFHGRFWDIALMSPEPRPARRAIPILIGGHSEFAIDRAARLGDGWIAAGVTPDRLADLLPRVRGAAKRHDRATLPVYCRAGAGKVTVDILKRYQELGVHTLQVNVATLDDLKRFAEQTLPRLR
jgi:probable F420-dependent oxidoreductase